MRSAPVARVGQVVANNQRIERPRGFELHELTRVRERHAFLIGRFGLDAMRAILRSKHLAVAAHCLRLERRPREVCPDFSS